MILIVYHFCYDFFEFVICIIAKICMAVCGHHHIISAGFRTVILMTTNIETLHFSNTRRVSVRFTVCGGQASAPWSVLGM
jgi:hypothetical protein